MIRIERPKPFDLKVTAFSHGWVDLETFRYDESRRRLSTACLIDGRPIDLAIEDDGDSIVGRAGGASAFGAQAKRSVKEAVVRMLRLDEDLLDFWKRCRRDERLRWAARRGAGRILRAADPFEDFLKILFTTNCTWAATRLMTKRLVLALGQETPSGARAFPSAAACLAAGPRFFEEVVRAGYRAGAAVELAQRFAEADPLAAIDIRDADATRKSITAWRGFGPYAAGQAMRLLGAYQDFALDSWCRAELMRKWEKRKPPGEKDVARAYAEYGDWRGLALWLDLTAGWHRAARRPLA